jgi:hypothetical protein
MIHLQVLEATNSWWMQRKDRGAHHFIIRNVPFLFLVVEALYLETQKLPLQSQMGSFKQEINKDYVLTIGMFLPVDRYSTLRTLLSLCGDIYNITSSLLNAKNGSLMELQENLQSLFDYANKFRNVRNFFTHLDEALTDMDRHGITGSSSTNCGISYGNNAKGCVHLILDGNDTIHFTSHNKAQQITIERKVFTPIFDYTRAIYSELISHTFAKKKRYTPPGLLFPSQD